MPSLWAGSGPGLLRKLKIVFANLNGNLYADGSRILSARLKNMGHRVRMVFLIERERDAYTEDTLHQFVELCAGADLILLSFLSDGYLRAARLTRFVRSRLDAPVVWGGLHATIDPESCMEHVDILCRGEGDEALPEFITRFAEGKTYHGVPNFWVRREGEIIRNDMRPLLQDLDANPWPDYGLKEHFVRDEDERIKPMTQELMAKFHNTAPMGFPNYQVTSTRGCAQICTYCYNATFKEMFPGQRRIRFRSLDDVVEEIRSVLERYPFFRSFSFSDDDFFLRPKRELQALAELIRERLSHVIERSFWSAAVTPSALNQEKLEILVPAGLRTITIGVQTGSERMNLDVYKRRFKNALFLEKADMLDRHFQRQLVVLLDFMVNCPYETEEDHVKTVELLMTMPRWFLANLYRFTFYPGAPIYERAVEEGLIDRSPNLYSAKHFWPFYYKEYPYMVHVVFFVASLNYLLPDWVKRLLVSPFMRRVGRSIPQRLLDLIPWNAVYLRLWTRNQQAVYKGRELKHA
jgi:radical SAM superfamily enzyme YgiQ (UPF0313 family)